MATFSNYYAPQRTPNDIVLYLSPKQKAPEAPPPELQGQISRDVWNVRIPAITRIASRYSKVIFERLWLLAAFLASIVVPTVVYRIMIAHLPDRTNNNTILERNDSFFKARGISFAVLLGILLLFFVPISLWKFIGARRVNALLQGWAREDQAAGIGSDLKWTVQTPSVFRDSIILRITMPRAPPPTSFHPNAYIPSYINGPADVDAQMYYKGQYGYQQANSYDALPLYTNEKGRFEDVKV